VTVILHTRRGSSFRGKSETESSEKSSREIMMLLCDSLAYDHTYLLSSYKLLITSICHTTSSSIIYYYILYNKMAEKELTRELTKEEVAEFKEAFEMFDMDGGGAFRLLLLYKYG